MVYVFISLTLLLIVGPIIAILPSARQKERMKMRMAARAAGVSVELTAINHPNEKQLDVVMEAGRDSSPSLKLVCYRLQRKRSKEWRQFPRQAWRVFRDSNNTWQWDRSFGSGISIEFEVWVTLVLGELPVDVVQIKEENFNISLYWNERTQGDEKVVLKFLKDCEKFLQVEFEDQKALQ